MYVVLFAISSVTDIRLDGCFELFQYVPPESQLLEFSRFSSYAIVFTASNLDRRYLLLAA